MPKAIFIPSGIEIDVADNTKILVAATRAKAPIRFGCGACRCGTCGVAVTGSAVLSEMGDNERRLLTKMQLNTAGHIRLACQTRIVSGTVTVDLDFQDKYKPEEIVEEGDIKYVGDEYLSGDND